MLGAARAIAFGVDRVVAPIVANAGVEDVVENQVEGFERVAVAADQHAQIGAGDFEILAFGARDVVNVDVLAGPSAQQLVEQCVRRLGVSGNALPGRGRAAATAGPRRAAAGRRGAGRRRRRRPAPPSPPPERPGIARSRMLAGCSSYSKSSSYSMACYAPFLFLFRLEPLRFPLRFAAPLLLASPEAPWRRPFVSGTASVTTCSLSTNESGSW